MIKMAQPQRLHLVRPCDQGSRKPVSVDPVGTYLARLGSRHSRDTIFSSLKTLARLVSDDGTADPRQIQWALLRYPDVLRVRSELFTRYPSQAAGSYLGRLRQVMRECWRLGLLSHEEFARAWDIPTVSKSHVPQRFLTPAELAALWRTIATDTSPHGVRDLAILAVLVGTGMRREELAALDRGDLDCSRGEIVIRRGKGNKARDCWLSPELLGYVQPWLKLRGPHPGPLWHPIQPRQQFICRHRRLGSWAIARDIGGRRAREAGIREFGLHSARRAFSTALYKSGVKIKTISELLGHANIETTLRHYVNADRIEAEAVAKAIKPPHQEPEKGA